ncbi:nuclease A inhibitor family protein (plasmid) [Anabaena sp. FACHB-709]|uniref:Sugar-non-specific nuclease inhibitor NuiA homolog n=2 Tax=Nostocaceae TaxID=1162 RepID=A0A1Z4KVJ4_ANAVA|nr:MULTISPECIES: nuclease A inhibitor family protein [Nostocaceae]BAY72938.1 sugar-non-specific nuclease inhibitor NuiA homolog [Trichormus variabilis NIES-23]MBD2175267.1 nuclease A inhibitor family protein [Anabaena cylindrica FACHB-318]MBD2267161.1 nuclease A inhibitor family protein [Anabaena sp. FACHB-709]MBD2276713.1 nuclease A inhibitor family protein [Nostoc sp. PCC 7120 = FACHB-418]MBD2287198.1 nuclease A inhibitor family protein [Anabaena cylindrica FACHB-170]
MTNEITEKLKQASDGLLMMSESEYPFEVFLWSNQAQEPLTNQKLLELTGHPPETSVETVDLDYLFRNCAVEKEWHDDIQKQDVQKFQTLVTKLKDNLTDIKVYRLGTIDIDVYIVGKTPSGDLAGIFTKVIET